MQILKGDGLHEEGRDQERGSISLSLSVMWESPPQGQEIYRAFTLSSQKAMCKSNLLRGGPGIANP